MTLDIRYLVSMLRWSLFFEVNGSIYETGQQVVSFHVTMVIIFGVNGSIYETGQQVVSFHVTMVIIFG